MLGLLAATLARAVQDFIKHGVKLDALVNLTVVMPTAGACAAVSSAGRRLHPLGDGPLRFRR